MGESAWVEGALEVSLIECTPFTGGLCVTTVRATCIQLCSKLAGNPRFLCKSRGRISIKGLGDRQTYFVELAHGSDSMPPTPKEVPSVSQGAPAEPTLPGANQCQLIKLPAMTRHHNPSTFPEEEKKSGSGLHRTVVDMVKPQAPLEEAWITPTPSARTSTDSYQQGTPRVTRGVSPSTDFGGGEGAAQKCNRSLFIGPGPSCRAPEPPLKAERNKSKCVVC